MHETLVVAGTGSAARPSSSSGRVRGASIARCATARGATVASAPAHVSSLVSHATRRCGGGTGSRVTMPPLTMGRSLRRGTRNASRGGAGGGGGGDDDGGNHGLEPERRQGGTLWADGQRGTAPGRKQQQRDYAAPAETWDDTVQWPPPTSTPPPPAPSSFVNAPAAGTRGEETYGGEGASPPYGARAGVGRGSSDGRSENANSANDATTRQSTQTQSASRGWENDGSGTFYNSGDGRSGGGGGGDMGGNRWGEGTGQQDWGQQPRQQQRQNEYRRGGREWDAPPSDGSWNNDAADAGRNSAGTSSPPTWWSPDGLPGGVGILASWLLGAVSSVSDATASVLAGGGRLHTDFSRGRRGSLSHQVWGLGFRSSCCGQRPPSTCSCARCHLLSLCRSL
jgi:hypothetical protein